MRPRLPLVRILQLRERLQLYKLQAWQGRQRGASASRFCPAHARQAGAGAGGERHEENGGARLFDVPQFHLFTKAWIAHLELYHEGRHAARE